MYVVDREVCQPGTEAGSGIRKSQMKKYPPISDDRSQLIGHIAESKNVAGVTGFATIDFFTDDGVLYMTLRSMLKDLNIKDGQIILGDPSADYTIKAIPPIEQESSS